MPDKAAYPLASMLVPFGVARDTLAQADERIGALGSGVGALVDALAQRMNGLPASAVFQPFANAQQLGLAGALQGVAGTGKPRRKGLAQQARRAVTRSAVQGTHSPVAWPLSVLRMLNQGPSPMAPTGGLAEIVHSIGGKRPRRNASRRPVGPVQAAARAAQQTAEDQLAIHRFLLPVSGQLAADLVGQLLKTVAPAAGAFGGLPLGRGLGAMATQGMLGQPGLGNVVQDAMAGVLGSIAPPQPRPRAHNPRSTVQAVASTAVDVLDSVHLSGILGAVLDAIAKDKPAARQAAGSQPRRAAKPPTPAAPRAPTRLLPPAAGTAAEAAAGNTPRAAPPSGADDGNAALDELHRALLDQAWLRGVDLR